MELSYIVEKIVKCAPLVISVVANSNLGWKKTYTNHSRWHWCLLLCGLLLKPNLSQHHNHHYVLTFCIITAFFRILIAYRWLVAFSLHKITLPNVPLPSIFKNWKSSKLCNKKPLTTVLLDILSNLLYLLLWGYKQDNHFILSSNSISMWLRFLE